MEKTLHFRIAVAGALLLGASLIPVYAVDSGFPAPSGDASFVPAGAKLDRVFDGGCILSEGVAAGSLQNFVKVMSLK